MKVCFKNLWESLNLLTQLGFLRIGAQHSSCSLCWKIKSTNSSKIMRHHKINIISDPPRWRCNLLGGPQLELSWRTTTKNCMLHSMGSYPTSHSLCIPPYRGNVEPVIHHWLPTGDAPSYSVASHQITWSPLVPETLECHEIYKCHFQGP